MGATVRRYSSSARVRMRRLKRQSRLGYGLATRVQKSWRDRAVSEHTDIVIDGFPRSGNTYATVAFLLAQSGPIRIAHHLHSPLQVAKAEALGKPCLVLLRNPIDAVASLATMRPSFAYADALREYRGFYERLPETALIAGFDEVTNGLEVSIGRLNRRYCTEFEIPPSGDEGFDERVFDTIDVLNAMRPRGPVPVSRRVSRPTGERREILARHREEISSVTDRRSRRELLQALDVFERLSGGS